MASPAESDCSYQLIRHYFGSIVADVYQALNKYDCASLKTFKAALPNHTLIEVKTALFVLIKHQLVDFSKSNKGYEYLVAQNRILYFFRTSKYIHHSGQKYGRLAALVVKSLAQRGLMSKDALIQATFDGLSKLSLDDSDIGAKKIKLQPQIEELIALLINRNFLSNTSGGCICINIERFDRDIRDELIIEEVLKHYNNDKKVHAICEAILKLSINNTTDDCCFTSPVALRDISMTLLNPTNDTKFHAEEEINEYLSRLSLGISTNYIVQSGHHPTKGKMFAVNIGVIIDRIVKENVSSIVRNKFGPKCCRIFRMLLYKGPLLLKQLEDSVMLPNRDVREYVYMLIKEGFIKNRQVPKTPDNAPSKSIFILSVELDHIVYNTTDLCCRTISNLLVRHEFEKEKHKSLLDRAKTVQEIIYAKLGEAVAPATDDWCEYFNNHELASLNQINKILRRITFGRLQVDETLFLLKNWLIHKPSENSIDVS